MISMFVVAAVTAAMIIVLSAFNGIENLVSDLFSSFDAEITIVPASGKTIDTDSIDITLIQNVPGVAMVSEIVEGDVWINYGDQNTVATIKGVDPNYAEMSTIDTMMYTGEFRLMEGDLNYCVVGRGIRSELGLRFKEGEYPVIHIHAPIRGKKLKKDKEKSFNSAPIMVGGVYSVNADLDVKYLLAGIGFCKDLFGYDHEVSAFEVSIGPEADADEVADGLRQTLGLTVEVHTRYDKNMIIYQTNASEKWATFLILLFILIIAAFNIVASLTMLIIEKKRDIFILQSMGATRTAINRIFILDSVFIYFIGALVGIGLGVLLCVLQQQFGLIRLEGAMIPYYPVAVEWGDLLNVTFSVMAVGILFSIVLVRYLVKRFVSA
ncbi:MAG: ABC transporter permease [Flavobacteriales bacterium]|nr:ABC transporter permease [Flavobacteriales bacterium]